MIRWKTQDLVLVVAHFFIFIILMGITSYNPYVVVAEAFLLFFHGMLVASVGFLQSIKERYIAHNADGKLLFDEAEATAALREQFQLYQDIYDSVVVHKNEEVGSND